MLRLGIIGVSDGNGHPYSWSAIFNGYDEKGMQECPYPSIYRYLKGQQFPDDAIPGASVTHVWTESHSTSKKIAAASRIPFVVDRLENMIPRIDGLLLARDDARNHLRFARPFLDAGIPIYIDKPLAVSTADAERLLSLQKTPWQIFSCTALRFSRELIPTTDDLERIGEMRLIDAVVPKSWEKYAIHIIEPVLQVLGFPNFDNSESTTVTNGSIRRLTIRLATGLIVSFSSFGDLPSEISMSIKGTRGEKKFVFVDSFQAFKSALMSFISGVRNQRIEIPREQTLSCVNVIEKGLAK